MTMPDLDPQEVAMAKELIEEGSLDPAEVPSYAAAAGFETTPQVEPAEPGGAGREPSPQDDAVAREVFERHATARQPQYQPSQQLPPQQLPNVQEDPIGYFTARAQMADVMALQNMQENERISQYAQAEAFQRHLTTADTEGKAELGEAEYNAAMDHLLSSRREELARWAPDGSRHALQLARQHGFPSAAHMREAILMNDIAAAVQTAAAAGTPLWAFALNMARERGFRPNVAATNTQRRGISNAVLNAGSDKAFDEAWRMYERVYQAEDELGRRPRR